MRKDLDSEENALVQKSLRGNRQAQKVLYQKYVKAMYHTVIRMVPNAMDAEDIVQESFMKVFQNLHTYKGDATLGAWIKRITVNSALNHIRKNKKVSYTDLGDQAEMPEESSQYSKAPFNLKRIHKAIKGLPEGCRVVFSLRLLEGYQHKEIAEILGITESTSKTQFRRARQLLQKTLKGEFNY